MAQSYSPLKDLKQTQEPSHPAADFWRRKTDNTLHQLKLLDLKDFLKHLKLRDFKHSDKIKEKFSEMLSRDPFVALAQLNKLYQLVFTNKIKVPYYRVFRYKQEDEAHETILKFMQDLYVEKLQHLPILSTPEEEKITNQDMLWKMLDLHPLFVKLKVYDLYQVTRCVEAYFQGVVRCFSKDVEGALIRNKKHLTRIDIENISNVDLMKLLNAVRDNPHVTQLKVNIKFTNTIDGHYVLSPLTHVIQKNKTLVHVDLGDGIFTGLDNKNDKEFLSRLEKNFQLHTIKARLNKDDNSYEQKRIAELVARNKRYYDELVRPVAYLILRFISVAMKLENNPELAQKINSITDIISDVMRGNRIICVEAIIEHLKEIKQKFTNKLAQKEIENAIWLIDYLNEFYLYEKSSPLHIASAFHLVETVKSFITELKADVNVVDDDKLSPLHFAAFNNCVETAKALVAAGAKSTESKIKETPLLRAKRYGNKEVAKFLEEAFPESSVEEKTPGETKKPEETKKPNPKWTIPQINAGRRLFYLLGGAKLSEIAPTEGTLIDVKAGTAKEAYTVLAENLECFIKDKLPHLLKSPEMPDQEFVRQKLNKILKEIQVAGDIRTETEEKTVVIKEVKKEESRPKTFEDYTRQRREYHEAFADTIKTMEAGVARYLRAGCMRHFTGACIEREEKDKSFTLTITDRGLFATSFTKKDNSENYFCVKTINFTEDKLFAVLDKVISAADMPPEKAKAMLFKDIPAIVGKPSYDECREIEMPPFDAPICFVGNTKPLIYKRILKEFPGYTLFAQQLYKEIFEFNRKKATDDYEEVVVKVLGKDAQHAAATIIVQEKQKKPRKFMVLFPERVVDTKAVTPIKQETLSFT